MDFNIAPWDFCRWNWIGEELAQLGSPRGKIMSCLYQFLHTHEQQLMAGINGLRGIFLLKLFFVSMFWNKIDTKKS